MASDMTPISIILSINVLFLTMGTLAPTYPHYRGSSNFMGCVDVDSVQCTCLRPRFDLYEVQDSIHGVEARFLCLGICLLCIMAVPWSMHKMIDRLRRADAEKLDTIIKLKEPRYHVVRQTVTQSSGMERGLISQGIEDGQVIGE